LYSLFVSYSAAIVLAYITGMVAAYFLVRRFVFDATLQPLSESAPRFVVVNALAVLQTWAVSVVLAGHLLPALGVLRFAQEIGHAVGVVVPAFTSFIGHRRWTFRRARADAGGRETDWLRATARATNGTTGGAAVRTVQPRDPVSER